MTGGAVHPVPLRTVPCLSVEARCACRDRGGDAVVPRCRLTVLSAVCRSASLCDDLFGRRARL